MPKANDKFYEALELFLVGLNEMVEKYYAATYIHTSPPNFYTEEGSKLVRIVRDSNGSRSVHCFVDKKNGDVLKAASWKAPAEHPRSNIYDEDSGLSGVGPFGAVYLKGKYKPKAVAVKDKSEASAEA